MSVKKLTLFAVSLLFGCAAAPALTTPAEQGASAAPAFPAELDGYIADVLARGEFPGIAIAVVRNDSILVAKGYGVRDVGKPGLVDANTIFDIASLGKSFTATAVARLVDRGVLHWDDPIRRYLPDIVLPSEHLTANATIRDFLSHRTGLYAANMMWVLTSVDRAEILRRMRYLPVSAGFREMMVYSNIGYTVAGEAVAAASGQTIESMLRDVVIRPLGLSSTTWTYEQTARMQNVASPHAVIDGRQQPIRRELQRSAIAAAAAVQSSALDLTRWMRLHLNNGVLDGVRYVSDSAIREMHSVQAAIPTTPAMRAARLVLDTVTGYALGLQRMDYRGHPLLWHTGNGDGQVAYMALLPRDRLGVVVLVNTWAVPLIHLAIANRILDTYLGYQPRDWAGETLDRLPALARVRDSIAAAMVAMRSSEPPPLPLRAYVGRYDNPLYGPLWIRLAGPELTLQMGEGQIADLEHHGNGVLYTRWRDGLFREVFGSHLEFAIDGGTITSLKTRINRDEFTAIRAHDTGAASGEPLWRDSWPRTRMAVVSGDPRAPGPFVFRFRMPDGYWICPHTHPIDAHIEVVSGTFLVGMGGQLSLRPTQQLTAGSRVTLKAGAVHFEGARGHTELEVRGSGPWEISFLDPGVDPSRAGHRVCEPGSA